MLVVLLIIGDKNPIASPYTSWYNRETYIHAIDITSVRSPMIRLIHMLLFPLLIVVLVPHTPPLAAAPSDLPYRPGELLIQLNHGLHFSEAARAIMPWSTAEQATFSASERTEMQQNLHIINQVLENLSADRAESLGHGSATYQVHFSSTLDVPQLAQHFTAHPAVEFAEPNYIRRMSLTPNDPLVPQQWPLVNMQAFEAWNITTGSDVVIAVLDTGVASSHPDLTGKVLPGYNAIRNTTDTNDDNGHGTGVAGLMAARTNNGVGVAGICWGCLILPVKVLDYQGIGDDAGVTRGIRWATDNGARVMNLSLGGSEESSALRTAVNYAHSRGLILVAASGNERREGNLPNYPAAYDEVIAVGATGNTDVVASFSNTGDYVDLTAPGVGLWTTTRDGAYGTPNGTSFSSPFVAAAAGLVLSIRGDLSNRDVECTLAAGADDKGPPGKDPEYGWGRLNLYRSLQIAQSYTTCPLGGQPSPPPDPAAPQPAPQPQPPAPQQPIRQPAPQPEPEAPEPAAPQPPPEHTPPPPAMAPVPPGPMSSDQIYFPQTQHTLRGEFRRYWEQNGGLAIFGYPISEPFTERTVDGANVTVQYFQRHRLELRPENPPPYQILLSRIGDHVLLIQGRSWFTFPRSIHQEGCLFFPGTGHSVCDPFLSYWRTHGLELDGNPSVSFEESLALFGQPISQPQVEEIEPGVSVTVQWFERARFEEHDRVVLLGLLGEELVRARGWIP